MSRKLAYMVKKDEIQNVYFKQFTFLM